MVSIRPHPYGVVGARARECVVLGRSKRFSTPKKLSEPSPVAVLSYQRGGYCGQGCREGGCVGPESAVEDVVTFPAEELVVSLLALEDVVATEALNGVVAPATADLVRAGGAGDGLTVGGTGFGAVGRTVVACR